MRADTAARVDLAIEKYVPIVTSEFRPRTPGASAETAPLERRDGTSCLCGYGK